jgi:hypothetical protein
VPIAATTCSSSSPRAPLVHRGNGRQAAAGLILGGLKNAPFEVEADRPFSVVSRS